MSSTLVHYADGTHCSMWTRLYNEWIFCTKITDTNIMKLNGSSLPSVKVRILNCTWVWILRRPSYLHGVPGRSPDFRRLPRDFVRSPAVEVGVAIVTSYTGMLPSAVVSSVAMTTSLSVTAYTNCSSCVGVGGDLASSRVIPWNMRKQVNSLKIIHTERANNREMYSVTRSKSTSI